MGLSIFYGTINVNISGVSHDERPCKDGTKVTTKLDPGYCLTFALAHYIIKFVRSGKAGPRARVTEVERSKRGTISGIVLCSFKYSKYLL